MHYTEVTFLLTPSTPWRDILMVELAELGFDSFEEGFTDPDGRRGELKAYIPTDRFDAAAVQRLRVLHEPHVTVSWSHETIAPRNWNAEWERSFSPVEVDDAVRIRAEFHASVPGFRHELVVTPRMAFGTGHHATTRMMVRAMLGLDLAGKQVCDLGCGTAVLAILAEKLGAAHVDAVDYDQGAVDNARENVRANACERIVVEKGDVDFVRGRSYGAILANIERNTLQRGMEAMAGALAPGGFLLLSGFVRADLEEMHRSAREAGLHTVEDMNEGEWALSICERSA